MRQSNLELCRIFSIMLVVLVHSCFGWIGWPEDIRSCDVPLLFVEALSCIGVNVFVILTGYFSTSIKAKSIINLLYICLFYAIVRLVVGYFTGNIEIKDIFFISRSNWFIPTYLGLVFFTPWLNAIEMNKKMGGALLLLIFHQVWFGYFPSLAEVSPGYQYGYSIISFTILYLIARYIRLVGLPSWMSKYSLLIYFLSTMLIAVEAYTLLYFFSGKSDKIPDGLNHYVYAYNNPLVIISALSFFLFFEKLKMKQSKMINYIAKSVLAVLLIHGSAVLNIPMIKYFNGIYYSYRGLFLVLLWVAGLFAILLVSIVIDQIRIYSYKIIEPNINKLLTELSQVNIHSSSD